MYDVFDQYVCTHVARTGAPDGGNVGVSMGGAMGGANYPSGGASSGGNYDLDDFEDESAVQESQDYAYLVRSRLASEHKQRSTITGFEVYTIQQEIFVGSSFHSFR